jgi:hypothetical protein
MDARPLIGAAGERETNALSINAAH